MNPFALQKKIEGVKHIIAVASGKGGVGKSTLASQLALALSRTKASLSLSVGLLDADIYGPSIPQMMGLSKLRPNVNAQKKIEPLVNHGIKTMSMGYLVDDQSAIIWRGPMLFKAMDQFLRDVEWGELEYLVVDLPPGTGDVQLSLVQKVPISGAVIISTPQDIALLDVRRCVDMFTKVKTPILGLIENMASFECPHCHESSALFQAGQLHRYCTENNIPLLGQIPFSTDLGKAAESGLEFTGPEIRDFDQVAEKVIQRLQTN